MVWSSDRDSMRSTVRVKPISRRASSARASATTRELLGHREVVVRHLAADVLRPLMNEPRPGDPVGIARKPSGIDLACGFAFDLRVDVRHLGNPHCTPPLFTPRGLANGAEILETGRMPCEFNMILAGLHPAIHVFRPTLCCQKKTWVAGSSQVKPGQGVSMVDGNHILQPDSLNRTAVGQARPRGGESGATASGC